MFTGIGDSLVLECMSEYSLFFFFMGNCKYIQVDKIDCYNI